MCSEAKTVSDLLRDAASRLHGLGIESSRLDAEVLLAFVLGISRETLYRELETRPSRQEAAAFVRLLERRSRSEPIAYITGKKDFWSLDLEVGPDVLVPRPDTETVIEEVLEWFPERKKHYRFVDACTGSGNIALALAREYPRATIVATDISVSALRICRRNVRRCATADRVHVVAADLLDPLGRIGRGWDGIFSNPPYILSDHIETLPRDVRDFEPKIALDGGSDGLRYYAPLIRGASALLRDGGWLILEVGGQAAPVSSLFDRSESWDEPEFRKDLTGQVRVVSARRKSTSR